MRVYLTSAYDQRVALRFLVEAAARDAHQVHELVDSPARADAILFVENGEPGDPFYSRLRAHPLVRSEPGRVYMYNEWDYPYMVLPGLYASMPSRSFDARHQAGFAYLFAPNEHVTRIAGNPSKSDLLFSFMGAPSHGVRRRILTLSHPRGHIEDTSTFSLWTRNAPDELARRKRNYADVLARSKFVLCPRGAGTSSYRFFETLEAGRAPVLISDQWVAPEGPDWSFLVRVAEREVARLPETLERLESEAADRGRAARAVWEQWFAPDVIFHRAIDALERVMRQQPARVGWQPMLANREYVRVRTEHALRSSVRRARALAAKHIPRRGS